MTSFAGAIGHGLRHLVNFRGRDTRSQFWFYVLGLFIAQQAVTAMVVTPLVSGLVGPFAADATPPDSTTVAIWIRHVMLAAVFVPVVAVGLLAAAVTRRLHDRALSGWWGAMPLPFLAFGTVAIRRFMTAGLSPAQPDLRLFGAIIINNALYLLALLALIVLLCLEGVPGPNRFGEPSGGD